MYFDNNMVGFNFGKWLNRLLDDVEITMLMNSISEPSYGLSGKQKAPEQL